MRHYWQRAARIALAIALPPLALVTAGFAAPAIPAGPGAAVPASHVAPDATPNTQLAQAQNDPLRLGKRYAARAGCLSCHSLDGSSGIGPTWKGLFGKLRPLTDGTAVMADEAYLRRSILEPDAHIADGFAKGVMPTDFGTRLTDKQLGPIIELIKSVAE